MRTRWAAWLTAAALVAAFSALTLPTPALGQAFVATSACPDDNHAKFHACALAAARTFRPPLTAEGKPDLSGY